LLHIFIAIRWYQTRVVSLPRLTSLRINMINIRMGSYVVRRYGM
jgi:hypothetical protein